MARNQPKKTDDTARRVVCRLENASTFIGGVAFATLSIDGEAVHLSEGLPVEHAERLVGIPGYELWDGDEATHARAIEDALDAARRAAPAPGTSVVAGQLERELNRQIDELQRANLAQAEELAAARRQVALLTESNTALTNEVNALKAAGVRVAA